MSLSLSTREQEVLMIGVQGCLQNSDGLKVDVKRLAERAGFKSTGGAGNCWAAILKKLRAGNETQAADAASITSPSPAKNTAAKPTPKKRSCKNDGDACTPIKRVKTNGVPLGGKIMRKKSYADGKVSEGTEGDDDEEKGKIKLEDMGVEDEGVDDVVREEYEKSTV